MYQSSLNPPPRESEETGHGGDDSDGDQVARDLAGDFARLRSGSADHQESSQTSQPQTVQTEQAPPANAQTQAQAQMQTQIQTQTHERQPWLAQPPPQYAPAAGSSPIPPRQPDLGRETAAAGLGYTLLTGLNEAVLDRVRTAFVDAPSGEGVLYAGEFLDTLGEILRESRLHVSRHALSAFFDLVDTNGNGFLDWEQFFAALVSSASDAIARRDDSETRPFLLLRVPAVRAPLPLRRIERVRHLQRAGRTVLFGTCEVFFVSGPPPRVGPRGATASSSGALPAAGDEEQGAEHPGAEHPGAGPAVAFHRVEGHTAAVLDATELAPLRAFVTSSTDRTLVLWDSRTVAARGKIVTSDPQISLLWDDKNKQLITGSSSGSIFLWADAEAAFTSTTSSAKPVELVHHRNWVTGLALIPSLNYAVAASLDHTLSVWDLSTRSLHLVLTGHAKAVNCVAADDEHRVIFSGGVETDIMCWSPFAQSGGGAIHRLKGHRLSVVALVASAQSHQLFSLDEGGYIHVWSVRNYHRLQVLRHRDATAAIESNLADTVGPARPFTSMAIDARRQEVLTLGAELYAWARDDPFCGDSAAPITVAAAAYNSLYGIIYVAAGTEVSAWSAATGSLMACFDGAGCDSNIASLSLDTRERQLLVGMINGAVRVFWVPAHTLALQARAAGSEVIALALRSEPPRVEDKTLFVACYDAITALDVSDGESARPLHESRLWPGPAVASLSLAPRRNRAAVAFSDATIRLVHLGTGGTIATFTLADRATILCVELILEMNCIVVATSTGHWRFLSAVMGLELARVPGPHVQKFAYCAARGLVAALTEAGSVALCSVARVAARFAALRPEAVGQGEVVGEAAPGAFPAMFPRDLAPVEIGPDDAHRMRLIAEHDLGRALEALGADPVVTTISVVAGKRQPEPALLVGTHAGHLTVWGVRGDAMLAPIPLGRLSRLPGPPRGWHYIPQQQQQQGPTSNHPHHHSHHHLGPLQEEHRGHLSSEHPHHQPPHGGFGTPEREHRVKPKAPTTIESLCPFYTDKKAGGYRDPAGESAALVKPFYMPRIKVLEEKERRRQLAAEEQVEFGKPHRSKLGSPGSPYNTPPGASGNSGVAFGRNLRRASPTRASPSQGSPGFGSEATRRVRPSSASPAPSPGPKTPEAGAGRAKPRPASSMTRDRAKNLGPDIVDSPRGTPFKGLQRETAVAIGVAPPPRAVRVASAPAPLNLLGEESAGSAGTTEQDVKDFINHKNRVKPESGGKLTTSVAIIEPLFRKKAK